MIESLHDHQNPNSSIQQVGMNGQGLNQSQVSAAMLRAAQQQSQSMPVSAPSFNLAMFQNQQQMNHQQQMIQQQQQQQQPQQQMNQANNMNLNNEPQGSVTFDISSEIKRIQQLHQLGNNSASNSNALLMQGGQRNSDTNAFLQSMLDQQKAQNPRFDNPLAHPGQPMGGGGGGGMTNPLLQPSFLQDARFLMAQNQLNAASLFQENPLPSPHSLFHRDGSRRMRGGVIEPFPEKLHRLLMEVEAAGRSDVISFVATGRAFAIHKPDKFFKEIVPLYFRQSRLSSFKRQLNLYGFELINSGPARGGYFHDLFVKDHPELCRRMRRVAVKVGTKDKDDNNDNDKGDNSVSKQEGNITVEGAAGEAVDPLLVNIKDVECTM